MSAKRGASKAKRSLRSLVSLLQEYETEMCCKLNLNSSTPRLVTHPNVCFVSWKKIYLPFQVKPKLVLSRRRCVQDSGGSCDAVALSDETRRRVLKISSTQLRGVINTQLAARSAGICGDLKLVCAVNLSLGRR